MDDVLKLPLHSQVRELVRYKVDMTAVNSKGFTPMDVACLYGHTKVRVLHHCGTCDMFFARAANTLPSH